MQLSAHPTRRAHSKRSDKPGASPSSDPRPECPILCAAEGGKVISQVRTLPACLNPHYVSNLRNRNIFAGRSPARNQLHFALDGLLADVDTVGDTDQVRVLELDARSLVAV